MTARTTVEHLTGDCTDDELRIIASSIVRCDWQKVCQVAMVVTIDKGTEYHDVLIATTISRDAPAVARLLRHASAHVHGGCRPCRRRKRRRARHASQ